MDDVLDLGVGQVVSSAVFVRTLRREERFCGLDGVLPELLLVLLGVVGRPFLVHRQRVGQVNRRSEVELGILFYPWLFVDGLQRSQPAEPFVEVNVGLAVGQAHYYLVDGRTPAHPAYGTVSYRE